MESTERSQVSARPRPLAKLGALATDFCGRLDPCGRTRRPLALQGKMLARSGNVLVARRRPQTVYVPIERQGPEEGKAPLIRPRRRDNLSGLERLHPRTGKPQPRPRPAQRPARGADLADETVSDQNQLEC